MVPTLTLLHHCSYNTDDHAKAHITKKDGNKTWPLRPLPTLTSHTLSNLGSFTNERGFYTNYELLQLRVARCSSLATVAGRPVAAAFCRDARLISQTD